MKKLLTKNQNYEATISLSFLEGIAPNEMIVTKLREAGFENVRVEGTGQRRKATGTWGKETQLAEIPKQVSDIK